MVVGQWTEAVHELAQSESIQDDPTTAQGVFDKRSIIEDFLELGERASMDHESFSLKAIKRKAIDQIEKEVISHVLDQTGWNKSKAAKILKVSYKTLLYKITDLNIAPPPDLRNST
jgi:DNA-binding NtrC family response regulator